MLKDNKKILMVMPALPFPYKGADQMDRAYGIKQLIRLGFNVKIIAKTSEWQDGLFVKKISEELKVEIIGVPYKYSNKNLSIKDTFFKFIGKIKNPLFLDGAAFEYSDKDLKKILNDTIISFKPDLVWFEYTYLWPLYPTVLSHNIPIVTRSVNYEPQHFLEEDGFSLLNIIKYIPKYFGEKKVVKMSDLIFSITPKECEIYRRLGAKRVVNLPLRALPEYLDFDVSIKNSKPLNVFFMGSTYTVSHNLSAIEVILKEIAPNIFKTNPNDFVFHILGNKFPKKLDSLVRDNVVCDGYVADLDSFLSTMDIAIVPSLFGAGMQQKIFESLYRGFPTITTERGMGDYPFKEGEQVLFADDVEEFCSSLISLKDPEVRVKLSKEAKKLSKTLFSQEVLDKTVLEAISIQKEL